MSNIIQNSTMIEIILISFYMFSLCVMFLTSDEVEQ